MPPLQIREIKKKKKPSEELPQQQETQTNESSSSQPVEALEEQPDSSTSSFGCENQPDESKAEKTTTRFFQAIGIIEGEISFNEQDEAFITISGHTYSLMYLPLQKYKLLALKKEIENTGNTIKRLVVYPRAVHFPKPHQPQQIQFQLVRFGGETRKAVSGKLENMEFKIAGLWQFIPVCKVPCISIFKNVTPERIEWIKEADSKRRVGFMKPAHLPIFWKDAPVKPFRYKPKAEEQEKTAFVKIKAKFLPDKNAFGFISLLEEPTTEEVPKFLKASKKDKQLAQQQKKEESNPPHPNQETNPQTPLEQESRSPSPSSDNKAPLSFDEQIKSIANELETSSKIAEQNQGKQAELITNQLIAHRLKDENYTLPKNYISNWKYSKNLPKETSKHYAAYRLWELTIGSPS